MRNGKKYISEYIGTFALVFCGTGAVIINQISGNAVTHLGIGMTFGLIVMAMIYTFGPVSGAHINPAVSLAFWLSGRFDKSHLIPYIIAQFFGAFTASYILKFMFPDVTNLGLTQPFDSPLQSLILETILTFILMLVIINTSTGSKEIGLFAGLGIGATVMLEAIFAGPISGASMNPARSLGPALASLNFTHVWIYFIGPCVGAALAIIVWKFTTDPNQHIENRN